ncbi:MAG: glycosyltransferase family 4 protein [Candidatus Acidiferrales bacterium]
MNAAKHKPRVAIVSPFLDKWHGTERPVVEWTSRLCDQFEIHIYTQAIEDVDLAKATLHRIPMLRGPHILNFLWWFAANHLWRSWDHYGRGLRHDIVLTPGTNCLDADVVSVHIVFAEFVHRVKSQLEFTANPLRFWPRLLHRRLYYRLIIALERRIYTNPRTTLVYIARKVVADVERFYGCRDSDTLPILYAGIDQNIFNPDRRRSSRVSSRRRLQLADSRFFLLLVGNDWHKKGIRVLLDSLLLLRDLPVDLLLVGSDDPSAFSVLVAEKGLSQRVHFLPPRKDVEFYYAAADIYIGASLEDAYALPPAEAMACALPVIVSSKAGVSEIITHGVDGLILNDPTDAESLASMIRKLYVDPALRGRIGENAAQTARQFTWEQNAHDLAAIFQQIIRRKSQANGQTLPQES